MQGDSGQTSRAERSPVAVWTLFQLFEPKPQAEVVHNYEVVCEHMKRSCHHAGVVGKPTALLVHEDLGDHFLPDIAALMARGGCRPDLPPTKPASACIKFL